MSGFISLDNAKFQLRLEADDTSQDVYLADLIATAGKRIEKKTGFVCPQRIDEAFVFDGFEKELRLPLRPVDPDSIAIAYIDSSGETSSFADFRVFVRNGYTRIAPAFGKCWPATWCAPAVVTVTADVGFVDEDDAAIPDDLKHAARLMLGSWYENREEAVFGSARSLPDGAAALLEDERSRRV
ncbi:head-tail connector protein [Stakelama tenebrarum]|uniref:Phage gp6-like head-tail connector protein n=1 Tax=Stakelama tenebrarum TaxID=2711215 RepID=A0A6G6Y577_9SPHN|nr:hypothetical protein [Sphingosinithalassobacter tenebrarum]QIG80104.1 hypothetical protein G5C33_10150 [Sphingosinithalassobacter tenebrarum]